MRPQCCFLFCSTVQYRLLTGHILCTSWWTYLISWRSNGMTSALTYILFSLLVLSSGTIVPQCCLRGELFKTLPSLYHRVNKCFEGPLMLKYLRITSEQGFERLWIWWKHLELIFFQIPPPPKKIFQVPMSKLPPSFMKYQNISPLIKPHAWILKYIFIFSCLKMKSVQDSEWPRSTQRFGHGRNCDNNLTEDTNTSRMKQLLNSSSLFKIFHLEY